jgi:hypothetical protein
MYLDRNATATALDMLLVILAACARENKHCCLSANGAQRPGKFSLSLAPTNLSRDAALRARRAREREVPAAQAVEVWPVQLLQRWCNLCVCAKYFEPVDVAASLC